MSVRPEAAFHHPGVLSTPEGELVSATICVQPHLLEALLETLADVQFPINPQIYHNASVSRLHADGREEVEPATLVEFPAYSERLDEVRLVLQERGFDPGALWARNMLDEIHSGASSQPAPPGSPFVAVVRRKQPAAAL